MPIFLDTRGNPTLGIGICGRCSQKFPLHELMDDPNAIGLKVCEADRDEFDPYRLPARQVEEISLPFCRPDVMLENNGRVALFGPEQLSPVMDNIQLLSSPVTSLGPTRPWQPNTWYNKGDTITPLNVDLDTTNLPQAWIVCLESGWSSATPPVFPTESGIPFRDDGAPVIGPTPPPTPPSEDLIGGEADDMVGNLF
jgi:hypothetical protein